jgi:hypothetical protein
VTTVTLILFNKMVAICLAGVAHDSGPIPTEASLRSGESAHQNKGWWTDGGPIPVPPEIDQPTNRRGLLKHASFDSGATTVNIHSGQPDQARVNSFYGTHLLPAFGRPV